MQPSRRQWVGAAVAAVVMGAVATHSEAADKGLTFEIYKDAKGEFRWRLKAGNSAVIATSGEGYKSKEDCQHGIELIQKEAAKAKVEDHSDKK